MQQSGWRRVARWAVVLGAIGMGREGLAEDYFLTVGGGIGATSTQISIERNVLFQQRVLAEKRPDRPSCVVLFADGDDSAPDVQFRDPNFSETCPPARRLLAEILGDPDDIDLVYRNNEIKNLQGPSSSGLLKRQLRTLGGKLKSGDRLIIYATGHGGPAEEEYSYYGYDRSDSWEQMQQERQNKHDTSFYFYDGESVTASEFSTWLDRLPSEVEVVLVMVQCYAGGFAHTVFHQADASLGLSNHARCGFFAQVHDRGAAGCTPNANESEYEEYSSYFWGALAGESRTGEQAISADYDGDGKVSFAEAHAYAVIASETIDIPIRTSDAFLRKYSSLGKQSASEEKGEPSSLFGLLGGKKETELEQELIEMSSSLAKLAELARPDRRAILEQLAEQLELDNSATAASLRLAITKTEAEMNLARARHATAYERYTKARQRMREELVETWPELNTDYSPLAMALVNERADEFLAKVQGLAAYDALEKAKAGRNAHEAKSQALTHREAKLQRLLATCESVVLAANLAKVMPQEMVTRYEAMVAMEEGSL